MIAAIHFQQEVNVFVAEQEGISEAGTSCKVTVEQTPCSQLQSIFAAPVIAFDITHNVEGDAEKRLEEDTA
jgi:hypothetical protein